MLKILCKLKTVEWLTYWISFCILNVIFYFWSKFWLVKFNSSEGVGAVVIIPLGGVAIIGSVLISGVCVALGKATMKKVEKHESVKGTAESSLNTVDNLVSRALEDGIVSNEDFHHILREMENYRGHKAGIKHRTRANLIELTTEREAQIRAEAEQAGLEKGKKEALKNLLSTVTSSGAGN